MYLSYADIDATKREQPMLRLQTLAGKELGPIQYAHDVSFTVNLADLSEFEFTIPYYVNGAVNPCYDNVVTWKQIYTDNFGKYIITNTQKTGDGISEEKTVTGYSLEKSFAFKNLYLEEGTYNFWNPVTPDDTILGRILELDTRWSVGSVDSRLIGCYRTFDEYNDNALDFCYSDAPEKYLCAFVFDVYNMTINVLDTSETPDTLPIYITYDNLVEETQVEEIVDDFCTKLHVYGADDLSIRAVNPIGSDYIINLDYFIANGDLDITASDSTETLATRVTAWQTEIAANQTYYTSLISLQSSITAQKLTIAAEITDLEGELATYESQQSVTIQALALETTDDGVEYQEELLAEIKANIDVVEAEIEELEAEYEALTEEYTEYTEAISEITSELSYSSYFTEGEQELLTPFLIEGNVTEETFVATSVESSVDSETSDFSGNIVIEDSTIYMVEVSAFDKTVYTLTDGTITVGDNTAEIIRGSLIVTGDDAVLTAYLGTITYDGADYSSGMITMSGAASVASSDIEAVTENEITENIGSTLTLTVTESILLFTVDISDYTEYSVALELYEFGDEALDDYAWPVYEFEIDTANFLYHEKFEPFKDRLELGKCIRLGLGSEGIITAKLIGVEIDFNDIENLGLVFSNQYQRKSGTASWIDEIKSTSSSSRSFDASKYLYNLAASKTSEVSTYMDSMLNAAVQAIVNAEDQTVKIDSAGIHVGGDSNYQLRIIDSMIAMTDDDWETAKLAIGRFYSEDVGEVWGINAELVAGNLIIGNNLVLQNETDSGTMTFQVDSTGVWLYNSQILIQSNNGSIMIHPDYGIAAGNDSLYTTSGTTVYPSFVDDNGDLILDDEGMPEDANFFLDINSGDAYFRGTLIAQSGEIGGFTITENLLYSDVSDLGYIGINGSGTNTYSSYAFWCGDDNPANAPFWVKKDGSMSATDGTFTGTLSAVKLSGALAVDEDDEGWIRGPGLSIGGDNYLTGQGKFYVDTNGNCEMAGNIVLGGDITLSGDITWDDDSSPVKILYARATAISSLDIPDSSYSSYNSSSSSNWHRTYNEGYDYYCSYSYDGGETWSAIQAIDFEELYGITPTTTIGKSSIYSPTINGGSIYAATFYATEGDDNTYMEVSADGISQVLDGTEKVFLGESDVCASADTLPTDSGSSTYPTFRLGAGAGSYKYIFTIQKDGQSNSSGYTHTVLLGLTNSSGAVTTGFEFSSDGTITVLGDLDGYSSSATAVFA